MLNFKLFTSAGSRFQQCFELDLAIPVIFILLTNSCKNSKGEDKEKEDLFLLWQK
jgi:hypothetical protein